MHRRVLLQHAQCWYEFVWVSQQQCSVQKWERQVQWMQVSWKATNHLFLCSEHFTANSFADAELHVVMTSQFGIVKQKCLKPGAVPTVENWHLYRIKYYVINNGIQATLSYDHTPVAVVLFTCICHCAYKHCHLSHSVVLSVTLRLNIVWLISVILVLCSATWWQRWWPVVGLLQLKPLEQFNFLQPGIWPKWKQRFKQFRLSLWALWGE